MPHTRTEPARTPQRIGVAADHRGFELKEYLTGMLRDEHYEVLDFGESQPEPGDDYPAYVVPLAHAVARGEVDRGVAICGSGVGACIAANKVSGVRACLIQEMHSAHQGVEDGNLNVICLSGDVTSKADAWVWVSVFLKARFNDVERHLRRLAEIAELERSEATL